MPAGLMIPTGNTPPMISTFADVNEFDSALALTQPNLLDTPLHQLDVTSESTDLFLLRDDEFDSTHTKSGSDNPEGGGSGEDQGQSQEPRPNKKKKYHRHTPHQIQEMEAFFKQCPHPDDKQRKELSQELGLDPSQVKFWFQNKRTQMKTQGERHENNQLKNENDRLRADNIRYREALSNAACPNCGGPTALGEMSFEEHHLRLENARLREEIEKISIVTAKHISSRPMTNYPLLPSTLGSQRALELGAGSFGGQEADIGGDMYLAGGLLRSISAPTEADKNMILELAVSAMQELITMAQMGQPLWIPNLDGTNVILNEEEYLKMFPRGFGLKLNGFRCEASRESAVIVMNHINLVEYLMDVQQWSAVFSGIVSKAFTLEVLSNGVAGNYNGALQVMAAELNLPTPLVDVRESYFVRYCKQHGEGIWAVVDVSLDNIRPTPTSNCRKRPSGCLIQETPSGYSKVTWIENVEVNEGGAHCLYKNFISSGTAFGAKRWLATLDRQCERLATALATNIPIGVIASQLGVKSTLKLAERMVLSFCNGVSSSTAQIWTNLAGTGADDVRVVSRTCEDDPGRPSGLILSAATTLWLPAAPTRVFDYLHNENSRPQWDILSSGGIVHRMAHIEIGRTAGNCVSLLKVNKSANSSQSNMLIVQESCTDSVVSLVVYAPVEMNAMNVVVHGGDSDYVEILPSGFAIFPDGNGATLLIVSFQILVEALPASKLTVNSVATVNNLIACTVDRLRAALLS